MVTLDAERLASTTAPARAARVEGGVAAQKSSQISMPSTNSGTSVAANSRSVPNGTVCPATVISPPTTPAPGVNQRFS